jgi:hypothetical protein
MDKDVVEVFDSIRITDPKHWVFHIYDNVLKGDCTNIWATCWPICHAIMEAICEGIF